MMDDVGGQSCRCDFQLPSRKWKQKKEPWKDSPEAASDSRSLKAAFYVRYDTIMVMNRERPADLTLKICSSIYTR